MTSRPGPELEQLIGEDAFVRLAEAFGGTRLLVPTRMHADHRIAKAIGLDAAIRMTERLAPDAIRVPLAHELRAIHYRAAGKSNAQIATMLGKTESGVEKLFARQRRAQRAMQYRAAGRTDAQIAAQLGIAERQVVKLFGMPAPARAVDDRQPSLFD